ncbi:MFS transporter [Nocardioides alcanivorans]|uniref:MFS transporter n=1 Tax=Nocardioides alcanivorans TaxID=2897352 RepID=UPI001F17B002|nr:MFS transporter [Nocardioides alcanivorans]
MTTRAARSLLALASVAVAFAAADTYVVVLALPEMMGTVKLPISELQRAAPIISGFLLGYVAMLPLIGRIADLRGRVPVLIMSLTVFAVGSLITALTFDMTTMVAGRFLQGVGGGGLVPATLALVADLYPVHKRGVPLGVVSAVQEIGSVLGPLFGALVLAVAPWQAIFVINVVVAIFLAVVIHLLTSRKEWQREAPPEFRRGLPGWLGFDWLGLFAALVAVGAFCVLAIRPASLQRDLTWGQIFVPYTGESQWVTPIGVVVLVACLVLLLRCWFAKRPLVDVRAWLRSMVEADLVGALLLAAALSGIILAFATADPEVQVFSEQGPWYLGASAVAAVLFVLHVRRAAAPLFPRRAFRAMPAWGSLVVSFLIGAALIAALIDIPIFARTTIHRESQLMAALVLVRFLVALPVGAVLGGWLTRRLPAGVVTALGMLLAGVGFLFMTGWEADSLESITSTFTLLLCGLGFGLALAPVNAALLASTDDDVHGVAAAMVVVARMIGMLVGISALTTWGLRRFADARDACLEAGRTSCGTEAALAQEHTVFLGAALCAFLAAGLALWLFRGANTRELDTGKLLRSAG